MAANPRRARGLPVSTVGMEGGLLVRLAVRLTPEVGPRLR
jgi:hypothetical protein